MIWHVNDQFSNFDPEIIANNCHETWKSIFELYEKDTCTISFYFQIQINCSESVHVRIEENINIFSKITSIILTILCSNEW